VKIDQVTSAYENTTLYTIKIDMVLNLKIQCVPFVTVAPHVDQNIAPSVVSNLLILAIKLPHIAFS